MMWNYKCPECEELFKHSINYQKHLKQEHNIKITAEELKLARKARWS